MELLAAFGVGALVLVAYAAGYGMAFWQILDADRRFPQPSFLKRLPWPGKDKAWPYALQSPPSPPCRCPGGAMMQSVYRGNGIRIHVIDIHLGGCGYAESIWRKAGAK